MITINFKLPVWFSGKYTQSMRRGIEKEGLRMRPDGYAARTPHPKSLGSKLTHPFITTDYSENLLELITEPKESIDAALEMLKELHVITWQALEDELIWPLSMPCMLSSDDEDILLADYGTSNIGKLKTLYRSGLGVRYGRRMQTIAGLHYNLSFGDDLFLAWQEAEHNKQQLADFKNDKYLALIRNFKRLMPLTLYLLGASPSVCACFLQGRQHNLIPLGNSHTYYHPNATSLRMGKLGYTNSVQDNLGITYNDLPAYISGLRRAIQTPYQGFAKIGIDDECGNPIQINSHILQIENEFYSPIRPKQITGAGETPTEALASRGIAYIEFRAIDLDPYCDIGIRSSTACFLEILALYCLLQESPELSLEEEMDLNENIETIVEHGRNDSITIKVLQQTVVFRQWLKEHLDAMLPIAIALDEQSQGDAYQQALRLMQSRAYDSELTLSAQVERDSLAMGGTWQLGYNLAKQYRHLAQFDLGERQAYYQDLATVSVLEQKTIEENDTVDFYTYLQAYRHF